MRMKAIAGLGIVVGLCLGWECAGQPATGTGSAQPPAARADWTALVADLKSPLPRTRVAAADALGHLGAQATPAIDALLDAMDYPEAWVVFAMMDAIKAMGPTAHPAIIDLFEKGSGPKRLRAGQVLWDIGVEARTAEPRVRALLKDPDPRVREMATEVLKMMSEEPGAKPGAARATPPQWSAAGRSGEAGPVDWPGFRGPHRDAVCAETGLRKDWPTEGPQLLWRLDGLGQGYSSVAIAGDTLYTLGDRAGANGKQYVLAYALSDRREKWAAAIGPPNPDGGPRSTPTLDGAFVYAQGTEGALVCLAADRGTVCWGKDLVKDFGGRMMSGWKFCESPLIDGDKLICTPGGDAAALVALDKRTGEVLWKSVVPALGPRGKDGAAYASPMVAEIEGVRQYVQVLGRGVVGVAADTGKFLWGYNRIANDTANIPNPAIRGNLIFVANGYNSGSALLRIHRSGDRWQAEEVYSLEARRFDNHHGGVVLVGDHVYSGVGVNKGDPACVDLATGQVVWRQKAPSGGSASVLYADGRVWFRYDRGLVLAVEASPRAYRSLGQFMALTGEGPAWAYPAIHRGRLYLRHSDLLLCYDLQGNSP